MRWARRVLSHPAFTGISRRHLHLLIGEVYPVWLARREGWLHTRRGGQRQRAAGAGRCARLRFADRLLVTLAHLRLAVPHDALAVVLGVDRSPVTRAIGQVRPVLANRGCALPSGVRLRTLADVFAYAAVEGVTLGMDATEIRVRRPRAGRCGRTAVVSGKAKQNTIKTTLISDPDGAMLWCGAHRPGRMHDATAVTTEGIEALRCQYPQVKVLVDTGYRGLATTHPDQVTSPPLEAAPRSLARLSTTLGSRTHPAVLATHPGRTCHRRTEMVAPTTALHRTPAAAAREHQRHRRPGLRPRPHLQGLGKVVVSRS